MKLMSDSDEQWLLDGICRECRRKDYCSKPCKRNKVRTEREINVYIRERAGLGKIFDALGVKEGESE